MGKWRRGHIFSQILMLSPLSSGRPANCFYICTPGNPAGAVMPPEALQKLIQLAEEHDFLIASDECYSEIYPDEAGSPIRIAAGSRRSGASRLPSLPLLSQPLQNDQTCRV